MKTEAAELRIRLCQHVALDGAACKEPALRQSKYCRHHRRVHLPPMPDYIMEIYPDRKALQHALQSATQDLARCTLDSKTASRVIDNLQKATWEFNRRDRERV